MSFPVACQPRGGQPNGFPAYGTLLSAYCDGYDKYGTYADGAGGTYPALIATNSTDCGYSNPPLGTLLSTYCYLFDLMGTYADGMGGSSDSLIESNSVSCGYSP